VDDKKMKRFQIITESRFIKELNDIAAQNHVRTEPHELPNTDQNFGLVEATAVIAFVYSVAELAELIVKVWKSTKSSTKVTIKTPKGEITVQGDSYKTTEQLVSEFKKYLE